MRFFLPRSVLNILEKLSRAGFDAYIVGGAVRDLIQGRNIDDWDFTTDATPEEIIKLFPGSFYDNKFGTVGVPVPINLPEKQEYEVYEVTTFRTEFGYSDKRRPDKVEWGRSLKEDLSRRDFTINAMALKAKNRKQKTENRETEVEIIDPYGGQKDLENKLIRAVGKPEDRFNEDALRMMRAFRLGAQLGFGIEPTTLGAIKENSQLIKHISWERIRDEILKTLSSQYPADGIMLLYQTGLLQHILPELVAGVGVPQAGHHIYDVFTHSIESLRHCPANDPIIRLAALLHDIGKPVTFSQEGGKITFYSHEVIGARMVKGIADRLRLPVEARNKLWRLVRWHMFTYNKEMTDAAIRRFIRRVGKDEINNMMMLRIGDRKGGGSPATSWRLRELQERIGTLMYDPLDITDVAVDGHDVMKVLGIKPGPQVGKVLNALFEEILEEPKKNQREYLLDRIKIIATPPRQCR
jgi:putative nucleotidyltransferase with HDIG domain